LTRPQVGHFEVAIGATLAYHFLKADWVLFRKTETYFSEKAYPEAIACYTRLLKNGFETPGLLNHLGTSYIAMNPFAEAATIFKNILKQAPHKLSAIRELGAIYVAYGRFKKLNT